MSELAEDIIHIDFTPNPVQRQFIHSKAKADFFSARMGEGKSAALCWACFHHTLHNPGARWLFIRDTWENLQQTTQVEFFEWFPPGLCGVYVASTRTFKWRMAANNVEIRGEVLFRGLDEEKDASKLQSLPLAGFAMDEPAPAAESGGIAKLIFTTAMSRLRQKGMNWYAAKLAANNPDESHWTYRTFIDPGNEGYACHQTGAQPENLSNLPQDYYQNLRDAYADRQDLIDRFVEGKYGFQRRGRPVTPAWNDHIHLADAIEPIRSIPLHMLWDFGHTPVCVITQLVPSGHWNILEALQGEDIGTIEHIEQNVSPRLQERYPGYSWDHTHDPAGDYRDQTTTENTPVRAIRERLGGPCHPGAEAPSAGIDPLNAVLSRVINDGRGIIQVDRRLAKPVWHALRGSWHFPTRVGGVIGDKAVKNIYSHPGDAMRYGASRFFPLGALRQKRTAKTERKGTRPRYFTGARLGFERPGKKLPEEAREL
jgi:hypothetical protein